MSPVSQKDLFQIELLKEKVDMQMLWHQEDQNYLRDQSYFYNQAVGSIPCLQGPYENLRDSFCFVLSCFIYQVSLT